jgi:hypothetical protein
MLTEIFGEAAEISGDEAVARVSSLRAHDFPLAPGPVVRSLPDRLVVDIGAATLRLQRMATIPSRLGGAIVNARGDHFEQVVQETIDQTSWQPVADLRRLVGRHLRITAQNLTDIDAIGAKGGVLLLASCKSIPYTSELDAGEYRHVRNTRTLVEGAVSFWDGVLEQLRNTRVGANYDLTDFGSICGVVITPHVIYVDDSNALADAVPEHPGLRKASSIGELKKWLESN